MRDFIWKVQNWLEAAWEWIRDLVRRVMPHADDAPELRSLKIYVFLFVGIVGLMILVGAVTFAIAVRGQPATLVPNVQGMDILDALADLQSNELFPEVQATYSSEAEKGIVLGQKPAPGTLVKAGKRVTLRVSRGPIIDKIENYVGMTYEEVKAHLQTLFATHDPNIVIKTPLIYRVSSTVAPGRILAQDPPAGTRISGVASLELVISQEKGADTSVLVGSYVGKSFSEAITELTRDSVPFSFSVKKAAKSSDQGVVLSQNPDPGTAMGFGQVLQLTMAGPGTVGKDNVFGLFAYSLPAQPIAVSIRLVLATGGAEATEILSMKHPGGPLSVPYIVPDGSELVLYVLDQEVAREKAAALSY